MHHVFFGNKDFTKMKYLFLFSLMVSMIFALVLPGFAQEPTLPAPTLVPPTLVPTEPADVVHYADYSGIATLQNEGVLRVGARFNMQPFSFLDTTGKLAGYEADVATAVASELGVLIEFVQVTGENEIEELLTGRVDALIGEQVHTRSSEQIMEFSHPYYVNAQRMVVLETSSYSRFEELNGQPVSVVQGSYGEIAVQDMVASGTGFVLRQYFTQNDALDALAKGEVQAMIGELDNLLRAGRQGMRLIEQPVRLDPYAIAVRRYDVNLRNAVNRSIQRLFASGRLEEIYARWFDTPLDFDVLIPVYESIFQDGRGIHEFNADIPMRERSLVEKIAAGEPLQVAGLSLNPDAPQERLVDPFNQAIMDEMARRWGATINYLPNSARNSVEFMFDGSADLAVGVTPRWDGADRFDYSRAYAVHGDRLMVLEGSRFQRFADFRGGSYIGFWYEFPDDRARIEEIAAALRVNTSVYEFRSVDEIIDQFNNRNVDGLFGDSLWLKAIITETARSGLPWQVFEDEEYSRVPLAIALPRNDADFRSLVDWTLQDMFLDGTYQRIFRDTFGEGEPLVMLTWSGDGSWLRSKPGQ